MNRDSDIPENILLALFLEALSGDDVPSGPYPFPAVDAEATAPIEADVDPVSPLYPGPERSNPTAADRRDDTIAIDYTPVFDSGDLSPVQPHFEALLKRRLRQEIAHRPPLFPWEKGLQDYPDTLHSSAPSVWLDHLKTLPVPAAMPEEVLANLLDQCQRVAQDLQQTGRRLVAAVEGLFPDQPQTLEYVAGLVARPAYRSTQGQTLAQLSYDAASTPQQVALAMLAAQSIFDALTLTVSADVPTSDRTWLTPYGPLRVQAACTAAPDQGLEVRATLPAAGGLVLTNASETVGSERSTAGDLVLRLNAQPGTTYRLEVSLGDAPVAPLAFQVGVAAD